MFSTDEIILQIPSTLRWLRTVDPFSSKNSTSPASSHHGLTVVQETTSCARSTLWEPLPHVCLSTLGKTKVLITINFEQALLSPMCVMLETSTVPLVGADTQPVKQTQNMSTGATHVRPCECSISRKEWQEGLIDRIKAASIMVQGT